MRRFTVCLPVAALLAAPGSGAAQEAAPAVDVGQEPAWSGDVGLSYLATGGNTETESLGLDLEAQRRPEPWGLDVKALFHSSERDGEKTSERYFASVRGKRTTGRRWELFTGFSAERNKFQEIDLRAILEAGALYKALLGPRHVLGLDFGVTFTDEQRVPPLADEDFFGALAGLRYDWAISETASLSQRLAYRANFDDSGDWRADSLSSLTAAINERLAVRLGYEIRYRNEPLDDNDDTDTTSKVSLVWNL